jgi:hypothetical protein
VTAPRAQLSEVGCIFVRGPISVRGSTSVNGYIYKGLGLGLRGLQTIWFLCKF